MVVDVEKAHLRRCRVRVESVAGLLGPGGFRLERGLDRIEALLSRVPRRGAVAVAAGLVGADVVGYIAEDFAALV